MLKGIAASAGVAIAKVYKLEQPKVEIVKVDNIDAANEIAKFNEALEATKKDIEGIKERAAGKLSEEELAVFDCGMVLTAQLSFLQDSSHFFPPIRTILRLERFKSASPGKSPPFNRAHLPSCNYYVWRDDYGAS